jgi:hypothetical protein
MAITLKIGSTPNANCAGPQLRRRPRVKSWVRLQRSLSINGVLATIQLALAAHGHARQALVPFALWNLGLSVEPCGEQFQLRCWNLPALNPIQQMLKRRGRQILSANLRHDG